MVNVSVCCCRVVCLCRLSLCGVCGGCYGVVLAASAMVCCCCSYWCGVLWCLLLGCVSAAVCGVSLFCSLVGCAFVVALFLGCVSVVVLLLFLFGLDPSRMRTLENRYLLRGVSYDA
jgi:hypothetical protein